MNELGEVAIIEKHHSLSPLKDESSDLFFYDR